MTEPELFRASLRPEYREPLRHGRFVGRSRELERLEEVLTNRHSSTILLAGYRGAGKTALMDQALAQASRPNNQIVVRIAPPHLDQVEGSPSVRAQLLRSMARGLYFESLQVSKVGKKLRGYILDVYNKTCLTELSDHRSVETATAVTKRERRSSVLRTSIDFSSTVRLIAGSFVAALVGTLGLGAGALATEVFETRWGIAAFPVVVLLTLVGGFTLKRSKYQEDDSTAELTQQNAHTQIAKLDLSDAALEHELSQSLTRLAKKGFRTIFVFDELDKLAINDDSSANIESTPTFIILTSLKNFFALGNAIYAFITDDAFYRKLALDQRNSGYGLAHTIFSDRLYVGPLHYSDIEALIDNSLERVPTTEKYDQFKNLVCWECNNHAFDVLQVLNGYVENHDGEAMLRPTLSGEHTGVWHEGSLPADWLTRAALQKHVGVAYDEARRSTRGEELYNQSLWESLRESAAVLLDGRAIEVIDDDVLEVPGTFLKILSSDDAANVSGAVHRMLIRMERHDTALDHVYQLTPEHDAYSKYIESEIDEIRSFRINPDLEYPRTSVASDSILLPAEELLLATYSRLQAVVTVAERTISIDTATLQAIAELGQICARVQDSGPRKTQKRSTVYGSLPKVESFTGALIRQVLDAKVEIWASEKGFHIGQGLDSVSPHSGKSWRDLWSSDFEPLISVFAEMETPPMVIGGDANDHSLVVIVPSDNDMVPAIQDAYGKCLADNSRSREERQHRLSILHVGIDTASDLRLPTETVEELSKIPFRGIYAQMLAAFSFSTRPVKAKLAGWSHFDLDAKLQNIDGFSDALNEASYLRKSH